MHQSPRVFLLCDAQELDERRKPALDGEEKELVVPTSDEVIGTAINALAGFSWHGEHSPLSLALPVTPPLFCERIEAVGDFSGFRISTIQTAFCDPTRYYDGSPSVVLRAPFLQVAPESLR